MVLKFEKNLKFISGSLKEHRVSKDISISRIYLSKNQNFEQKKNNPKQSFKNGNNKSNERSKRCFNFNKVGHFAKERWKNRRKMYIIAEDCAIKMELNSHMMQLR